MGWAARIAACRGEAVRPERIEALALATAGCAFDWQGLAGSRPGGRPTFLRRQESRQRRRPGFTGRPSADCPALLTPGGRRGTRRLRRLRQPRRKAPPVAALLGGSDGLSTRHVPLLKRRSNSNPSITPVRSVVARCIRIARSEPPSSGVLGGEVRGGCLSRHRRRVPPRPPGASSAGESSATPTTGLAGSPFLPSSLATQRRRAPAGARPGQRYVIQRTPAHSPLNGSLSDNSSR